MLTILPHATFGMLPRFIFGSRSDERGVGLLLCVASDIIIYAVAPDGSSGYICERLFMILLDTSQSPYNANLVKASLKLEESRVIAALLLQGVDKVQWRQAILVDNVLQKRSPSTANTFAVFIRQRLGLMTPELWCLIRDGSNVVATQAVLAATVKHSRLLGDFLDLVVRDGLRLFKTALTNKDWEDFVVGCVARDPHVSDWTPAVVTKLRQNVFRILGEAGYVADTKTLALQRMTVVPEIVRYLEENDERYVLRCIQVAA